jgi:DNA-directed RNA polymerase subunit RPC12/RpoP
MSYRSISKANVRYKLTVLFLLIGAFLLAMVLINIHPTAAIIVFWLGMLVLGAAALGEWAFRVAERAAARSELEGHRCPRCGKEVHRSAEQAEEWHCDECGAAFLDSGIEQI